MAGELEDRKMAAKKNDIECEACVLVSRWDAVFDPRMDEILDAVHDAGITDKDPAFDRIFIVVHDLAYDYACVVLGFPGAPYCKAHGEPIPESENCPDCAALPPFKVIEGGRE
jgi:hypothetical protein